MAARGSAAERSGPGHRRRRHIRAGAERSAPTVAAGPLPAPLDPATPSRRGSRATAGLVRTAFYPTSARLNESDHARAKPCTNAPTVSEARARTGRAAAPALARVGPCVILPRVLSAAAPFTREAQQLLRAPGHFNWSTVTLLAMVVSVYSVEVERANWSAILAGAAC